MISPDIVKDKPAIIIGKSIVITDLHLGYERELLKKGVTIPSLTKKMIEELKLIQKESDAERLIILGDLKHEYRGIGKTEWKEIPLFLRKCLEFFGEIIITKGNHDGAIEKLVDFERVKLMNECIDGEYGFMHGHSWPSAEMLGSCRTILMGHSHPAFSYTDHLGNYVTKKAWIIADLDADKLAGEHPKKLNEIKTNGVIITPTFNPLFIGGREKIGPLSNYLKNEKIILLDGTIVS